MKHLKKIPQIQYFGIDYHTRMGITKLLSEMNMTEKRFIVADASLLRRKCCCRYLTDRSIVIGVSYTPQPFSNALNISKTIQEITDDIINIIVSDRLCLCWHCRAERKLTWADRQLVTVLKMSLNASASARILRINVKTFYTRVSLLRKKLGFPLNTEFRLWCNQYGTDMNELEP